MLGAAGQAIYNAERFSQQNVKFHKVPELFPNRKVRTVRTEQLCFHTQTIRNSGLPFNGRHPHNPCKLHGLMIIIINHSFTDPRWMEGWVGLVGLITANTLPTKWSRPLCLWHWSAAAAAVCSVWLYLSIVCLCLYLRHGCIVSCSSPRRHCISCIVNAAMLEVCYVTKRMSDSRLSLAHLNN